MGRDLPVAEHLSSVATNVSDGGRAAGRECSIQMSTARGCSLIERAVPASSSLMWREWVRLREGAESYAKGLRILVRAALQSIGSKRAYLRESRQAILAFEDQSALVPCLASLPKRWRRGVLRCSLTPWFVGDALTTASDDDRAAPPGLIDDAPPGRMRPLKVDKGPLHFPHHRWRDKIPTGD